MKRKILYLFLLIMFLYVKFAYAGTGEILEEQKEDFGISTFVQQAQEYSRDFFANIDIKDMLDSAITGKIDNTSIFEKILSLLGEEVVASIKVLISILVIVVIHSVLKSISDSLESSNVSQIIYYVQYILIVTIIMSNFSDIIQMVKETADSLVGFMNALVPLLITLMMYTGSIVTSGVTEPVILFMINFLGNVINMLLIPIVLIITVLSIVSKISDRIQIDKLAGFLKSGVVWFLGIVLTLFVAVISIEGTLSSSIDGVTAKTAKATVSTVIPVVGKILRRCCRHCFRLWCSFEKCHRCSWGNNYYRNMHYANIEIAVFLQ